MVMVPERSVRKTAAPAILMRRSVSSANGFLEIVQNANNLFFEAMPLEDELATKPYPA